jgi:hypothetical protein
MLQGFEQNMIDKILLKTFTFSLGEGSTYMGKENRMEKLSLS